MDMYVILAASVGLAIFSVMTLTTARHMMAEANRKLQEANEAYGRATALFQEAIAIVDDRQLELELVGGKMNDR